MNLRELKIFILTAAVVMTAVSCKDDDDTAASYPSLTGLTFECPLYVYPEQVVKMTPDGVEHPDGEGIGYYWKVSPSMYLADTTRLENGFDPDTDRESDGSFVHKFSDTLATYAVVCSAFASGYAKDSYTINVTVVEGGLDKSVTKTGILETDPHITVDGIDYYYQQIGDLYWFRRNLADADAGMPYRGYEVTSDVFGRYYSYEEAKTACPQGWRLPTEQEWLSLCEAAGTVPAEKYATVKGVASKLFADACFNGEPMLQYWPAVGEITNELKVGLLPVGFANLGDKDADGRYQWSAFDGMDKYAAVWTADLVDGEAGMAYYRYLISDQPDFYVGKGDVKSFGASVRCVREAE